MACSGNSYFRGQGPLYIRQIISDCGGPAEGYRALGDVDNFAFNTDQPTSKHYESVSGNRTLAASWTESTDSTFDLSIKNISPENLAMVMQGTLTAPVVGGSVVDEVVPAWDGQISFTEFGDISAVTINDGDGTTPLVLDTDYTLVEDGRAGGIQIIEGAPNFVGPNIEVSYTHTGTQGTINAFKTGRKDYEIKFDAINDQGSPVTVTVYRAVMSPPGALSFVSTELLTLDISGDALVSGNGDVIDIQVRN